MNNKYYVYKLIDPRTDTPFYVGKGSGKRVEEYYKMDPKITRATKVVLEAIIMDKQIIKAVLIQDNLTEQEALTLEATLIKEYGRRTKDVNGLLTNVNSHGVISYKGNHPQYSTIQVGKEIKDQIVDYCNRHDFKIGRFIERIFLNEVSGSVRNV